MGLQNTVEEQSRCLKACPSQPCSCIINTCIHCPLRSGALTKRGACGLITIILAEKIIRNKTMNQMSPVYKELLDIIKKSVQRAWGLKEELFQNMPRFPH